MPFLNVTPSVKIAYDLVGEGPSFAEASPFAKAAGDKSAGKRPVVLIHGFASNRFMNWRAPGWYETLSKAGRQVIALDVRGHGESSKPHDIEAYDEGELARDVVRLLDHLGCASADVMGYSMGGFIALRLLHDAPERVRRAVIAGVGENYFGRGRLESDAIAAGLRARDVAQVTDPVPRQFRLFAEQGRNDLEALALCMTRRRHSFTADEMRTLDVPVLIVLGENDTVTGPPDALAEALPTARVVVVPRRDHMSTVGDKVTKAAVLEFLGEA